MNSSIRTYYLTCAYLLMLFCNKNTIAQDSFQCDADSLFKQAAYQQAAIAYEYAVFSCTNDSIKARLLLQKGHCYKLLQKYDQSIASYQRISSRHLSDTLYKELLFNKALCSYLLEEYSSAGYFLNEYRALYPTDTAQQLMLELEILTLHKQQYFDQAKLLLHTYDSLYPLNISADDFYQSLTNELSEVNTLKAEHKAKIYPGFGLLYLKNKKLGLSNLIVQGGLLTYTGLSFASGMYLNGLYGANLMFRFYTGQIKRTHIWAEHKKKQINNQYFKQLKTSLLTTN